MLLWMFVPPLGCAATSKALIDRGYPLCGYLMFGLITLPVTRIFFVDPILAWFKEDHLREVDALKEEN